MESFNGFDRKQGLICLNKKWNFLSNRDGKLTRGVCVSGGGTNVNL